MTRVVGSIRKLPPHAAHSNGVKFIVRKTIVVYTPVSIAMISSSSTKTPAMIMVETTTSKLTKTSTVVLCDASGAS